MCSNNNSVINHGGSAEQGTQTSIDSVFLRTKWRKEGWTVRMNGHSCKPQEDIGTVPRNTPHCIFPCFWQKIKQKCILGAPMTFFAPLHAPCDMISTKTMPPSGRATPIYILSKFEVNQTDSSWVNSHFCVLPLFSDLTIIWPSQSRNMAPEPTPQ